MILNCNPVFQNIFIPFYLIAYFKMIFSASLSLIKSIREKQIFTTDTKYSVKIL